MIRTSIALSVCAAMLATAAHAADTKAVIGTVKGEVLVSSGSGLSAAKSGAALKPGERIVARTGSVEVRYADGCRTVVQAGAMATIAARSPCAGGPGIVISGGSSAQLGLPDWPVGAYFAGAGVAVIAGALIYGATNPDSDSP